MNSKIGSSKAMNWYFENSEENEFNLKFWKTKLWLINYQKEIKTFLGVQVLRNLPSTHLFSWSDRCSTQKRADYKDEESRSRPQEVHTGSQGLPSVVMKRRSRMKAMYRAERLEFRLSQEVSVLGEILMRKK